MKIIMILTISLMLTMSMTQTVQASQIVLYPTEDTYISSSDPNINYVDAWFIYTYKSIYPYETKESIILLRFDVPNMSDLSNGTTINHVNIRLKSISDNYPTPTIGLYKYYNNSLDLTTVTWNNFPNETHELLSSIEVPHGDQYYYWNISQIDDGITTFVIRSTRTIEGFDRANFWSLSHYNQSYRPQLTIYYNTTTSRLKGDVNDDGEITSSDALLYIRYALGQDIYPFHIYTNDDVTCDLLITEEDALKVLRKAVGQDVNLEC